MTSARPFKTAVRNKSMADVLKSMMDRMDAEKLNDAA